MSSDAHEPDAQPAYPDRYAPAAIEPKWQAHWDEHQTFRATRTAGRPKKYILDMFPEHRRS